MTQSTPGARFQAFANATYHALDSEHYLHTDKRGGSQRVVAAKTEMIIHQAAPVGNISTGCEKVRERHAALRVNSNCICPVGGARDGRGQSDAVSCSAGLEIAAS